MDMRAVARQTPAHSAGPRCLLAVRLCGALLALSAPGSKLRGTTFRDLAAHVRAITLAHAEENDQ
jgi:hypothetical protein